MNNRTIDKRFKDMLKERMRRKTAKTFRDWMAPYEDVFPWEVSRLVEGRVVLVHNHIRHNARTRTGTNGFRAWLEKSSPKFVVCKCGWRPEEGTHYRVKGV